MMILGCRALSGDRRILLGRITVGGEGGTRNERTEVQPKEGMDLRGTTCDLVGCGGLGHPRDREPKGERPDQGREEGGYPPTPKGGVRRGIQESQKGSRLQGRNVKLQVSQLSTNRGRGEAKPDGCPIQRERGFEGLSRLSMLTWHGVLVNRDKGDKTKDKYCHMEEGTYRILPSYPGYRCDRYWTNIRPTRRISRLGLTKLSTL